VSIKNYQKWHLLICHTGECRHRFNTTLICDSQDYRDFMSKEKKCPKCPRCGGENCRRASIILENGIILIVEEETHE
jgi:hypothetical protein